MQITLHSSKIEIIINNEKCDKCLKCIKLCPTKAIYIKDNRLEIKKEICINCYACFMVCPKRAIDVKHIVSLHGYCV